MDSQSQLLPHGLLPRLYRPAKPSSRSRVNNSKTQAGSLGEVLGSRELLRDADLWAAAALGDRWRPRLRWSGRGRPADASRSISSGRRRPERRGSSRSGRIEPAFAQLGRWRQLSQCSEGPEASASAGSSRVRSAIWPGVPRSDCPASLGRTHRMLARPGQHHLPGSPSVTSLRCTRRAHRPRRLAKTIRPQAIRPQAINDSYWMPGKLKRPRPKPGLRSPQPSPSRRLVAADRRSGMGSHETDHPEHDDHAGSHGDRCCRAVRRCDECRDKRTSCPPAAGQCVEQTERAAGAAVGRDALHPGRVLRVEEDQRSDSHCHRAHRDSRVADAERKERRHQGSEAEHQALAVTPVHHGAGE